MAPSCQPESPVPESCVSPIALARRLSFAASHSEKPGFPLNPAGERAGAHGGGHGEASEGRQEGKGPP
eukprot:3369409-Pyramimonas_sp.AAC.1